MDSERTVLKNAMFFECLSFIVRSSKLPGVSGNLPEVSGNFPEVSGNFPKMSGNFPVASFQLPDTGGGAVQRVGPVTRPRRPKVSRRAVSSEGA